MINNQTHAFVDSNAYVHALGNVLILAEDDSQTTSIAGQATLGGSTVGVSAGALRGSYIDHQGYPCLYRPVRDGEGRWNNWIDSKRAKWRGVGGGQFPAGVRHRGYPRALHPGQIQRADLRPRSRRHASLSSFQLQITGSLGFQVLHSNTAAYIDVGSNVTAPSVNVSALNDVNAFGSAVNLVYTSGLGIAGGVDVGLLDNNTTATIGGKVTTTGNVEVYALSRTRVNSFVGAVGVTTGIGLVASISMYSIQADFDPILGIIPLSFLNVGGSVANVQSGIDTALSNFTSSAGGGISTLLNKYANAVGGSQAQANAIFRSRAGLPGRERRQRLDRRDRHAGAHQRRQRHRGRHGHRHR